MEGRAPSATSDRRHGASLATVARTRDRSVAGLERALRAADSARLRAAESLGLITGAREQRLLQELDAHLDRLVEWRFRPLRLPLRTGVPRPGGVPLFGPSG